MAGRFKSKRTGIDIDAESAEVTTPTEEETSDVTEDTVAEESTENDTDITDDIVAEPDIEQKKAAVKYVRVLPNADHNCCIGGTRYYLRKGVCQNVPPEVKDILNKAGLLSPL